MHTKAYSHHAILLAGEYQDVHAELCATYLDVEDTDSLLKHPDFYKIDVGSFGINDARALQESTSSRPIEGSKKIFVLSIESIAYEAQNALLKLFEDPPETAQFFILMPHTTELLPTLLSRLNVVQVASESNGLTDIATFFTKSRPERLTVIATITNEKDTALLRKNANIYISNMNLYVARNIKDFSKYALFLRTIQMAQKYISKKGASPKILLEELALSAPVF